MLDHRDDELFGVLTQAEGPWESDEEFRDLGIEPEDGTGRHLASKAKAAARREIASSGNRTDLLDLVAEVQGGSDRAFRRLVVRVFAPLCRIASSLEGSGVEIEDRSTEPLEVLGRRFEAARNEAALEKVQASFDRACVQLPSLREVGNAIRDRLEARPDDDAAEFWPHSEPVFCGMVLECVAILPLAGDGDEGRGDGGAATRRCSSSCSGQASPPSFEFPRAPSPVRSWG